MHTIRVLGLPNTAAPRCPFPSSILRHVTAEAPRDSMRFYLFERGELGSPVEIQPPRVLSLIHPARGPAEASARSHSFCSPTCVHNIVVLHTNPILRATSGRLLEIPDYILDLVVAS